jgi:uncharacterized membrane protein
MLIKSILLCILCFLLRIIYIDTSVLSSDEAFSIYYSYLPINQLWSFILEGNNPPLWEVILKLWIHIFDDSLYSVRFVGVVFSSVSVIPIIFIGEKYIKKNVGYITSMIYICSNFCLYISHEARAYNLGLFLILVSFYLYFETIYHYNTKNKYFYIIINALMFYTHYMSLYIWLIQLLTTIIIFRKREMIKSQIKYFIFSLILCLPIIYQFYTRILESGSKGTWINPIIDNGFKDLFYMISRCFNSPALTTISIFIILISIFILLKNKIQNELVILLWFLVPHIILFTFSFYQGFYFDKYLYFTFPAIYFLIALCFVQLKPKFAYVITASFILIQIYDFNLNSSLLKYHGDRLRLDLISQYMSCNGNQKYYCNNLDIKKELLYYSDKKRFKQGAIQDFSNTKNNFDFIGHSLICKPFSQFSTKRFTEIIYLDTKTDYSELLLSYDSVHSFEVGNIRLIKFRSKVKRNL